MTADASPLEDGMEGWTSFTQAMAFFALAMALLVGFLLAFQNPVLQWGKQVWVMLDAWFPFL